MARKIIPHGRGQKKDIRGLNEYEEKFCEAYVYYAGMDADKALDYAYNYNDDQRNRARQVRKLLTKDAVLKRINELIDERNKETVVDRLWVIKKIKGLAETAKNEMTRIRALELLGKHLAIFTDRQVVETGSAVEIARSKWKARQQEEMDVAKKQKDDKVLEFPNEDQHEEVA